MGAEARKTWLIAPSGRTPIINGNHQDTANIVNRGRCVAPNSPYIAAKLRPAKGKSRRPATGTHAMIVPIQSRTVKGCGECELAVIFCPPADNQDLAEDSRSSSCQSNGLRLTCAPVKRQDDFGLESSLLLAQAACASGSAARSAGVCNEPTTLVAEGKVKPKYATPGHINQVVPFESVERIGRVLHRKYRFRILSNGQSK